MRAVVQRVSRAEVRVGGETVGRIGAWLLVLVGCGKGDGDEDLRYLVDKTVNLRIFEDEAGKMNRSLLDVGGGMLVVSQFTLYGDTRKGRRPSFFEALEPEGAAPLVERFADEVLRGHDGRGARKPGPRDAGVGFPPGALEIRALVV